MDSSRTRSPLRTMTPRPIAESEISFAAQLDKLPDGGHYAHAHAHAQPRSAMTDATVAVPPPTVSPINTTVLPMRSAPPHDAARYHTTTTTSTESRTFVVEQQQQQQQQQQRYSYAGQQQQQQRFPDERFLGQKLQDQRFRIPDQRVLGQKYSEQLFASQRYPEQTYVVDQRYTEQRFPEQRYTEQRFSQQHQHQQQQQQYKQQYTDQRYHDGRPAEHQSQFSSQQYPNPGYPGPNMGSTAAPPPPPATMDYPLRPPSMQLLAAPNVPLDVNSVKSHCYFQLQEVMRLRRQRHGFLGASSGAGAGAGAGGDLEWQIRNQTGMLLVQLKTLQAEVRKLAKGAQNHRWRRWLIGGFIATVIPFIRRLFRRGADLESRSCSNNTEFAFRKSKGLISRIKENVLRHGHWASMAFFVFSVLFIFSNEVVFRVSKTIYKRIRKLVAKIEFSNDDLTEKDLKILEGWRWRVMLW